jgi:hypothetical protein
MGRLLRCELGLQLTERRFPLGAIELHEHVSLLDDVTLADVHLRDARRNATRGVDIDTLDDAAAPGGPMLGGAKMPHQKQEGDK